MGYCAEVGVGGPIDLDIARKWYRRVRLSFCHSFCRSNVQALELRPRNMNTDAAERLSALSQSVAQPLSRREHESITEHKPLRKRT
jgi:hypothetical protein